MLPFLDQKEKTNSDEELENTSLKSLSPHPTRTETIIASYSFENESVNSYSRIFTERSDEEMESSSLMLHNTHPTKTANNPSSIMGNVNSERKMIDNGRDAMENYQSGRIRNSLNVINDHNYICYSRPVKIIYSILKKTLIKNHEIVLEIKVYES